MGWITLLLLIAGALGLLWLLGVRGGLLTAGAAALLLGASGYALQGSPDLPAAPAQGGEGHDIFPLTDARHAFFGYFTPAESWLRMSEALERDGQSEDAVNILQNAVKRYPGDPQLWIGLRIGTVAALRVAVDQLPEVDRLGDVVDHARGLTPPAELAYKRAAALAPGHPGAPFFYGLALARSGDRQGAIAVWQQILKTAPAKAEWRPLVEQGVAALGGPSAAKPQAATGS